MEPDQFFIWPACVERVSNVESHHHHPERMTESPFWIIINLFEVKSNQIDTHRQWRWLPQTLTEWRWSTAPTATWALSFLCSSLRPSPTHVSQIPYPWPWNSLFCCSDCWWWSQLLGRVCHWHPVSQQLVWKVELHRLTYGHWVTWSLWSATVTNYLSQTHADCWQRLGYLHKNKWNTRLKSL